MSRARTSLIEFRSADDHYERLPTIMTELIRWPVAVIVANSSAARAAKAANALRRSHYDGRVVIMTPFTFVERTAIAQTATAARLPTIFEAREFVVAGGLVSYGPS